MESQLIFLCVPAQKSSHTALDWCSQSHCVAESSAVTVCQRCASGGLDKRYQCLSPICESHFPKSDCLRYIMSTSKEQPFILIALQATFFGSPTLGSMPIQLGQDLLQLQGASLWVVLSICFCAGTRSPFFLSWEKTVEARRAKIFKHM